MRIKNAIAKVLEPKSICEIGVSSGISALAFLQACPTARYVGIDNKFEEELRGIKLVDRAIELLKSYNAKVVIADSLVLRELPEGPYDMVHVDGCHLKGATMHDVTMAWRACNVGGWIVVDDAVDTAVAAGTFEALNRLHPGTCHWQYIEGWTGNILIRRDN
jgi:predicted O-methyltransferase YrrM